MEQNPKTRGPCIAARGNQWEEFRRYRFGDTRVVSLLNDKKFKVIEVADPSVIKKYSDLILRHCDLFVGSPTALADKDTFNVIRKKLIPTKIIIRKKQLQSLKNLSKQFNRSVYVPAGAFWGGNDIQKMAELGLLKGLTVTMTKHPSSFKVIVVKKTTTIKTN